MKDPNKELFDKLIEKDSHGFNAEICKNWDDENSYPKSKKEKDHWFWEFIRRNPFYQEDWIMCHKMQTDYFEAWSENEEGELVGEKFPAPKKFYLKNKPHPSTLSPNWKDHPSQEELWAYAESDYEMSPIEWLTNVWQLQQTDGLEFEDLKPTRPWTEKIRFNTSVIEILNRPDNISRENHKLAFQVDLRACLNENAIKRTTKNIMEMLIDEMQSFVFSEKKRIEIQDDNIRFDTFLRHLRLRDSKIAKENALTAQSKITGKGYSYTLTEAQNDINRIIREKVNRLISMPSSIFYQIHEMR